MRTERLGWLLCVALASMLAPTAVATISPLGVQHSLDPAATLEDMVGDVALAPPDVLGPGDDPAEGGSGHGPSGRDGPPGSAAGLAQDAQARAEGLAAPVVADAQAIADVVNAFLQKRPAAASQGHAAVDTFDETDPDLSADGVRSSAARMRTGSADNR